MTQAPGPLELWGGIECTVNRVGERWFDQVSLSGHDGRVDDLDAIASLGIRTLRYPAVWERVASSSPDAMDWRWTDERLERLRALGIRPILGLLHHGSGPVYTSLLDESFPALFAQFARAVAERYPWITDYTPINEPLTTARFSGLYGHWYPHARSDRAYVRALLNQMKATRLAMAAIRRVVPDARLIQTEDCGRTFGTSATQAQVAHENDRRWLTWDLLAGRVNESHPLRDFLASAGMTDVEAASFVDSPCAPDVLGLNYYVTSDRFLDHRVDEYPAHSRGGNGRMAYADVDAVRARPEGIHGHEKHLLDAWRRYGLPVAVTEAHLGCTREEQMRWLMEAWCGARSAQARGADVRAVTAWALLGSFNWDSLVTCDTGHYEPGAFDVRGTSLRATALASMVPGLQKEGAADHPALHGTPWWRRPERLLPGAVAGPSPSRLASRPPMLLIVGCTGTLGRAFQRICERRGLAALSVGRRQVDVTDRGQVLDMVRAVRPWGVINAAGYVRVDQAESDAAACRRINVEGAANIATACARYRARFVTFSSDLVFDGAAGRPYAENASTNPLSVYGQTKADAEGAVLEAMPEALVARTSAFFGPWDEFNFLADLFRHVRAGVAFEAPADSIVSPTYVPDLVDAALDLLIDGECGVWHLANEGAVTWFELGRMALERSGEGVQLLEAGETGRLWGPAVRPVYSALASRRGRVLRPLAAALDAYVADTAPARLSVGSSVCVSQ